MRRAAGLITAAAPRSLAEARQIVADCFARRYRDRRRPLLVREADDGPGAALIAPPGWLEDTPCCPEQTLRAAGVDDARQAAYQRKMSALPAGMIERPEDRTLGQVAKEYLAYKASTASAA